MKKQVKKWLFPVLTCLIVIGAAVLPPWISEARDAGQFGQIHAETLLADALPVYEPPSLLERIELYASQGADEHPILSFSAALHYGDPVRDEVIKRAKAALTESGILPAWYFTREPFEDFTGPSVSRILLWDPAGGASWQEPSSFWSVTFQYHNKPGTHYKNLAVILDGESGLPVSLHISDTNMAQWLPYRMDALQEFTERYFGALGLDVQIQYSDAADSDGLVLVFSVADTSIGYIIEHNATILSIGPYITIDRTASSGGFDG